MNTLHTLLQQAEGQRDQALAALQRAEELARRAQAQAEQLAGYRGEYRQRWSQQFSRQGTMDIVHCYQSFTQRLDEAIQQQNQQAAHTEAQVAQLRQQLVAAEMRVAAVKKLIERRTHEHRRHAERREQRQTDETAQQLRWRQQRTEPAQH